MPVETERWNHNLHYHRVILRAIPAGARRGLDVGCGEGILARQLRQVLAEVTAIDIDAPSLELARLADPDGAVDYICGDFLTYAFDDSSFDLVASVACLHHMDMAAALDKMAGLLRPGGTLALVGIARSRYPRDLLFDALGSISTRLHQLTKTYWEHSAPTFWPPPLTYAETRRVAEGALPHVAYRRHVLWRYSLLWRKPSSDRSGC
ncbi:MAG: class I SAM-dependent methyltransferase [Acidimicrobiales bacterium]|jgi:2-polyprenyl-3-methyl-5-hydroxy-6-metoxy-1,4-benzoquinol methylase